MLRSVVVVAAAAAAQGCSEFWLNDAYGLSGRTLDLGFPPGDVLWTMLSVPRGTALQSTAPGLKKGVAWTAKYGVVGLGSVVEPLKLMEGLNEAGLSATFNALSNSSYPPPPADPSRTLALLDAVAFVLTNFGTAAEAAAALDGNVTIWEGVLPAGFFHMAVRDADGHSAVFEWVGGKQHVYRDDPVGIMTNEPPLDYHIANMQYLDWKHGLTRQAVPIPGEFYPAERFARIHLLKQSLVAPKSHQEAVAQVVHVLDSVNVAKGMWGTDTGSSHTRWSVVRDHKNKDVYFRTVNNQLLQRVSLSSVDLSPGAIPVSLDLDNVPGDWYVDASAKLTPRK